MPNKLIYPRIKLSVLFCAIAIALPMNAVRAEKILPMFGDMKIDHKFSPDPMMMRGMSGGSKPAISITGKKQTPTGACTGFVDEKPDHTLHLRGKFSYLKLKVSSSDDATMIIKGPDGVWCNDDSQGQNPNPEIAGEWLPGKYQLWIGSFDQNKYFPYIIKITEVK
ncbi:MAG: hypothetical protein QNJ51_10985 [Calothrix sp. MO_167.B12]|nr:hypothetical protein [Calothrix sp. MO_167.B12]